MNLSKRFCFETEFSLANFGTHFILGWWWSVAWSYLCLCAGIHMSLCVHMHACVHAHFCICVCVHVRERERERERERDASLRMVLMPLCKKIVFKLHSQVTYHYYLFCSKDLQNHCILIPVETDVVQMLHKNTDLCYCAVFVQQFSPVCPYTGKV